MAPRQHLVVESPLHRKRNPITGYRIPDLIKHGEIVSDVTKKKWKIGKSIGVGAFGDIYLGKMFTFFIHTSLVSSQDVGFKEFNLCFGFSI